MKIEEEEGGILRIDEGEGRMEDRGRRKEGESRTKGEGLKKKGKGVD